MPDNNSQCLTFVLKHKNVENFKRLANFCTQTLDVEIENISVLSPEKALDIRIENPSDNLRAHMTKALATTKIEADFCLQSAQNRKKKLLICDMDSTLIGQECIDELADFAGVKERVSEITERAMRGELNFEAALKERVGLLKGLSLQALSDCYYKRITLNEGAKTLAATMKENGAKTVIVSGGFTFFTSLIAQEAGFSHDHANILLDDGKALTGEVALPILGRAAKKQSLLDYSSNIGGPGSALAIGDGANDLAMITASGLGIAYRAKPIVAQVAHCAINHTDLKAALYFQGYKDSEFI